MEPIKKYLLDLEYTIDHLPLHAIDEVIRILSVARMERRRIFIMGNGGSASTASHFVCDLAKNTRRSLLPDFQVVGLSDNMALLSAYANDEGYENVFVRQLASLVQQGDVVIAISTSGNSQNVINAALHAKEAGATTIGFTGFNGGQLGSLVDVHLHVPSHTIEHVEDVHLVLEHLICKALREAPVDEEDHRRSIPVMASSQAILSTLNSPNLYETEEEGHFLASDRIKTSLERLYSLANEIKATGETGVVLQKILQLCIESMGAGSGSIMVLDDKGDVTNAVLAYAGKVQSTVSSNLMDLIRKGLAGWVVENRQAALVSRTQDDPRWLRRTWDEENGSRSAVSVPLISADRVIGVMTLVHSQAERFSENDLVWLTAIAVCVSFLAPITTPVAREEIAIDP